MIPASRSGYLERLSSQGAWGATIAQLIWLHGYERARKILIGQDARANLDIVRWRDLGRPK